MNRTVTRIDFTTTEVDTVGISVTPDVMATGEGAAWVAGQEGPLLRIDASTTSAEVWDVPEVKAAIQEGSRRGGAITVGHGSLWLGVANELTVWRTDVRTGKVIAKPFYGLEPLAMAASSDALWVLDSAGRVSHIDPTTNEIVGAVRVAPTGGSPAGLAVGEGAVWVLDTMVERLVRIDPVSDKEVDAIKLRLSPFDAVTTGAGSVWVTDLVNGAVRRIDPATKSVDTIELGHVLELGTIVFGGGLIWVAIGEPFAR